MTQLEHDTADQKAVLHHYLQEARSALVWKLDGLGEREARLPRTATGNNLLGILKHCLNCEAAYFGPTFGRQFPTPEELVSDDTFQQDPQADWYATADETKDGLIDLYRRVWVFADETIERLPLDAPGRVQWWQPGKQAVTLQAIMVRVTCDATRHAGHADILREQLDGAVGWQPTNGSVPELGGSTWSSWPDYVSRLTDLANRYE